MGIKSAMSEAATGEFAEVVVDAGSDMRTRPTRAAVIRNFMSLQGEWRMLLSVIRSNCLQVKEKGVMVTLVGMTLFSSARRHRGTKASYWWWYACAEGAVR
jgi:hypothetical protein